MSTWRVLVGDVREQLATLPDASMQCCVTSPPYWGLRDYGTATWEGGDPACGHTKGSEQKRTWGPGSTESSTLRGRPSNDSHEREGWKGGICGNCGAVRIDSQIGLEPTPELYVAALVSVFREVRRVLADDGVLWVNLGDSYAAGGQNSGSAPEDLTEKQRSNAGCRYERRTAPLGLKPKDLVGIPWMVAFALRADGWYLRSDVIWAKLNPMPESVTDRPTKSHEYVFLLSKSARYYYDAEAISEAAIHAGKVVTLGLNIKAIGNGLAASVTVTDRRNARSVWTIPTQPYPDAHFATFPEALPERCIKAGSRLGDTVLDPFCGSGTTGRVAIRLGRAFVGIELNPAYAEMARGRIGGAAPLFSHEAAG
jgi:DNA modification methylase